ncbi:MAG: ankyrin repeat domain-containing protein, partial [Cytophagales bacterium]|nr:ankyrin repeat domain-containing protein [Cytophaga sp.]
MEEELLNALKIRNFTVVEELIKKGADVNHLFETGVDPIYWAVTENDVEMVKLLLQHKVEISRIYDKKQYSLLHYGVEN